MEGSLLDLPFDFLAYSFESSTIAVDSDNELTTSIHENCCPFQTLRPLSVRFGDIIKAQKEVQCPTAPHPIAKLKNVLDVFSGQVALRHTRRRVMRNFDCLYHSHSPGE